MKIFVTGISGTGKSTTAKKLEERGYKTIDIDHVPNLCAWVDNNTGEKAHISNTDGPDNKFMDENDYVCDTQKLSELVPEGETVFVFGAVGDNSDLLHMFDKAILFQCNPETMTDRLTNRDTNDFGKNPEVQERILKWRLVFDDLMLKEGAIPVNTDKPVDEVVEEVIKIAESD